MLWSLHQAIYSYFSHQLCCNCTPSWQTIVQTKFRQNVSLTSLIQLEKYKQSGKENIILQLLMHLKHYCVIVFPKSSDKTLWCSRSVSENSRLCFTTVTFQTTSTAMPPKHSFLHLISCVSPWCSSALLFWRCGVSWLLRSLFDSYSLLLWSPQDTNQTGLKSGTCPAHLCLGFVPQIHSLCCRITITWSNLWNKTSAV